MEKFHGNHKDRIILLIVILAGSIGIFFFMPWFNLHQVPCIHREITGIGCPLCGMTHAVYEMLHFRFRAAVHYHPAIPFMVIWFGMEWLVLIKSFQGDRGALRRLRSAGMRERSPETTLSNGERIQDPAFSNMVSAMRKGSFILFLAALGVVYIFRIAQLI